MIPNIKINWIYMFQTNINQTHITSIAEVEFMA